MVTIFSRYITKKELPALFFLTAAGTISHFLYGWTGSALIALVCPVNESVWEHLKLLFFPFLLWTLWNYIHLMPKKNLYFYSRLLAVLCGMLAIITLFYTYTGIIGQDVLVLDILTFIAGIIVSLHKSRRFFKNLSYIPPGIYIYSAWIVLILCFFLFTCFPPDIPLFYSYA